MYGDVIKSGKYIQQLRDFVLCEYGIKSIDISPAKRGFYGQTWRLRTAGSSYFIKVVYPAEHRDIYEKSFPVIEHLNRRGIDFVSKIVKTIAGKLSARFDGAVLGVFEWIEGENRQNEETKVREYQMLAKVYTVPTEGLVIPREEFSAKSADIFFSQWAILPHNAPICAIFERHRAKIEHRAKRLHLFSERCQSDKSPFFITHGDAGGNFIAGSDADYIVDWDTPILAPPERDAWFCMHWDWAAQAFCEALRQNGIDYILRPERMAYYCYHMFFFYLNAYLDKYRQTGLTHGIYEFINGWIEESFQYADNI